MLHKLYSNPTDDEPLDAFEVEQDTTLADDEFDKVYVSRRYMGSIMRGTKQEEPEIRIWRPKYLNKATNKEMNRYKQNSMAYLYLTNKTERKKITVQVLSEGEEESKEKKSKTELEEWIEDTFFINKNKIKERDNKIEEKYKYDEEYGVDDRLYMIN